MNNESTMYQIATNKLHLKIIETQYLLLDSKYSVFSMQ